MCCSTPPSTLSPSLSLSCRALSQLISCSLSRAVSRAASTSLSRAHAVCTVLAFITRLVLLVTEPRNHVRAAAAGPQYGWYGLMAEADGRVCHQLLSEAEECDPTLIPGPSTGTIAATSAGPAALRPLHH